MQLGEGVGVALAQLGREADPKCEGDSPKNWQSRVNKHNSQDTCTGKRLYDNMWAKREEHEDKGLGFVPGKESGTAWSVDLCSNEFFPIQAHHLIPKNYLPEHIVCVFLAIKYDDDPTYKLQSDSCYDTDDADNGYCMPYATPTTEWKSASNQEEKLYCAFQVMDKTKIQLHQGSHARVLDPKKLEEMAGKSVIPLVVDAPGASDGYEEEDIHSPGYLNKVELLLNAVHGKALAHIEGKPPCPTCNKGKSGSKSLIQPLDSVVRLMHQVSKIIKILVDVHEMHVSGYAYLWGEARGYLTVDHQAGKVFLAVERSDLEARLGS